MEENGLTVDNIVKKCYRKPIKIRKKQSSIFWGCFFYLKTILYKLFCLEIYVVKVMRVGFYKKLKRFSF